MLLRSNMSRLDHLAVTFAESPPIFLPSILNCTDASTYLVMSSRRLLKRLSRSPFAFSTAICRHRNAACRAQAAERQSQCWQAKRRNFVNDMLISLHGQNHVLTRYGHPKCTSHATLSLSATGVLVNLHSAPQCLLTHLLATQCLMKSFRLQHDRTNQASEWVAGHQHDLFRQQAPFQLLMTSLQPDRDQRSLPQGMSVMRYRGLDALQRCWTCKVCGEPW